MGIVTKKLEMSKLTYLLFGVFAICLTKVNADWTGSGELKCYSHYESDATCPEGMFFLPDSGEDFEIWAWDYHDGQDSIPYAECDGLFWYRLDDMGAGFCTPNGVNDVAGCGIASCTGTITCHGC